MNLKLMALIGGRRLAVRIDRPHDISIPVRFAGERMSVYGAPPARSEPLAVGGFVGNVARGGSCNSDVCTITPHVDGTHTECVGHISSRPIAVPDLFCDVLIPATLITISPQSPAKTDDSYDPPPRAEDRLITRAKLEQALGARLPAFCDALVIRTLPNDAEKRTRDYQRLPSPYFSTEAMRWIVEMGSQHLLVDMPSVDRLDDGGKLSNHRAFWGVAAGSSDVDMQNASRKTITELIYVPDDILDGPYLLNLQLAPLMSDAAPSRPVLYEIEAQH